jgi:hypothetical protein
MALPLALLGSGLSGAVSGCANDGGGQGDTCERIGGSVTDGATIGGIDYRVIGGFGGQGEGTSLQIAPEGTFTRQTRARGLEQGRLDRTALDDLVGKARAAQFPTLCQIYPCADCADDYVHDVSVEFDRNTYTVKASMLATPPGRLAAMIEALQAIVDRPLP